MFKWLENKYGGFEITQEVATLGGGWNIGRIRESSRGGMVKATKLEIHLFVIQENLPRVKATFW